MRILLLTITALLFSGAFSYAEFTVDERSLYHVGASAAISGTCNLMTMGAQNPKVRRWGCFTTAIAIGSIKEFAIDSSADMGDMAFNVLGAYLGVAITDRLYLWANGHSVGVTGTW